MIVNEAGREVSSQLGPYPEGLSVQVSCEVSGGKKILAKDVLQVYYYVLDGK